MVFEGLKQPETPAAAKRPEERAALIVRLFREHNDTLIRFLALRLRSQQEAREVAQEAYVRLLNLDRPGAVGFLRAFLFRTAANIAVDRIRHEQTTRQLARAGKFLEEFETQPTPEQAAASAQELQLLEKLMNELPAKCRRAFFLHRICGLDFPEVAAQMGLRERMVRNYVMRAVMYCRAGLDAANQTGSETSHE